MCSHSLSVGGHMDREVSLIVCIARTLSAVYDRATKYIATNLTIKPTLIRWVLTVPAIWDEQAKRIMRLAAYHAGIIDTVDSNNLIMALEPEAAALYVIADALSETRDINGSSILVVDAGGGTVDILMDQIRSTAPWALEECGQGADGGPWGGMVVDEAFLECIREIMELAAEADNKEASTYWEQLKRQTMNDLMEVWQTAKHSYSPCLLVLPHTYLPHWP